MTLLPFTTPWAEALCAAINSDESYRTAARGWTWPVALVLAADARLGFPEDVAIELQLDRGDCSGASVMSPVDVTAPFVLRADYATWKDVVLGVLDPLVAVTKGRVTLTGKLTTLLLHARAAKAMVACAQRVPTQFATDS
jgi:putative sterol carrier protein